jgi:hypothetical protein
VNLLRVQRRDSVDSTKYLILRCMGASRGFHTNSTGTSHLFFCRSVPWRFTRDQMYLDRRTQPDLGQNRIVKERQNALVK